jgi:pyridoxal phosphate enzyme (YggS family)
MDTENYNAILTEVNQAGAQLVAVSKTKPVDDILALYNMGQRIFGENIVQELVEKQALLPQDIKWHLIGHLQSNKVKYIAPFIDLIHSVDGLKLIEDINKHASKNNRVIDCLLQVFIADEKTKFGMSASEVHSLLAWPRFAEMKNIRICGLMGMATNTDDEQKIDAEFKKLKALFDEVQQKYFADAPHFKELSMGMSSDYKIAFKNGATLVRLGSALFGNRTAA